MAMLGGKKTELSEDLRSSIECAMADKRYGGLQLGHILDDAEEHDVSIIQHYVPDLFDHGDWTVRADALEFVGRFRLRRFLDLVKVRLQDRSRVVRTYALCAYYDLAGAKALPLLDEASRDSNTTYRITALVLRYIETQDEAVLDELHKALTRRRCRFTHRYAAMNTFDAYVDVGMYPEIIKLFEEVQSSLAKASRKYGLDKDIPRMLAKWKASAKAHRSTKSGVRH